MAAGAAVAAGVRVCQRGEKPLEKGRSVMAKDLLTTLAAGMPQFSKGQKLIARYLISHYDKAAFMTASRLGATVGVSESTVVRFATEVGFDGYPQLQRNLQELIRNRLTSAQRMEVTSDQIGSNDVLTRVLSLDMEKIRRTLEEPPRRILRVPSMPFWRRRTSMWWGFAARPPWPILSGSTSTISSPTAIW